MIWNHHLAKLIVYLVKLFEKGSRGLFKGKTKCIPCPKFKYSTSEMLALYFLLLLEDIEHTVRLKNFLIIKAKPMNTLLNEKLPRKSKINQFKNNYDYLIKLFLKFRYLRNIFIKIKINNELIN